MSRFEKQFGELQAFLQFEDFNILTKQILDLTLGKD